MSFLKKLFGGKSGASGPSAEPVEHEGYFILPAPVAEGGQYRVCATISKEIDGEMKEHRLIRADLLPSAEEAVETTLRKAKQIIREQGDRIFS
ncbi:MAG: HlyU family transcriptional regulator [Pseudomonadota bacterium]|nr:HlyU family transcriptional regulator [Pseudomonadota bacterium]